MQKSERAVQKITYLVEVKENKIENDRAIRDTIPGVWESAPEPLFHVLATCEGRPPSMNERF